MYSHLLLFSIMYVYGICNTNTPEQFAAGVFVLKMGIYFSL
ncbi:hypothetical protein SAMD00020551_1896 [Mesobacillus selenatarsenatis SF-1]|uniref:Uncharacterized protein n=1 Tax=Mesobacillus selenatarsenatis (strain DSM 18680 / JCM 14380 / FERM P-15431 / SF-1) TaxID=1321606 RepID=A0A0A8X172_MESS1|nr:hypothetical protein SAMD00020551_1896 [Mesobacillus selenatarsenatis SF-1]